MTEPRRRPSLVPGTGWWVNSLADPSGALTTAGYRAGAVAARLMPTVVAAGLATPFGAGASFASPERRSMIERHLRRVDPTLRGAALRRAVQDAFDWAARYWVESFRLPMLSARAVRAAFTENGYYRLLRALDGGNGAILAMPHLGGWEWAGRWLTDRGHRVTAVVERLEPPELFDWFAELRAELGMTVVPLGPEAGVAIARALHANEIVCLLSDRDILRTGPTVEFFGERTTLPAGPAMLALRTGAPLLPTAVYFTDRFDGHFGFVRPPIPAERTGRRLREDVAEITQVLAHELEILIRRAPTQWHLFQPNWPSDPGY